jgi:hypothetical protein
VYARFLDADLGLGLGFNALLSNNPNLVTFWFWICLFFCLQCNKYDGSVLCLLSSYSDLVCRD